MIDSEKNTAVMIAPGLPQATRWGPGLATPLLLLLALLGAPAGLRAQEFHAKFASSQHRKVVLDMHGSDVTVEGYDGDELVVRGSGSDTPPPALSNGLRQVNGRGGDDNTRMGLAVTLAGDNTLRVTRTSRSDGHYVVRLPRRTDVVFSQAAWGGSDDLTVRDIVGRVEVSLKSGDMRLLNIGGPVVANTISGDIKVVFSTTPDEPSAVSTVSGDVDITLPATAKTTLSMRSVSGEIYTDFDLGFGGAKGQRSGGGMNTVDGRTNGGGTTLSLKTVSGDVFVRKAK